MNEGWFKGAKRTGFYWNEETILARCVSWTFSPAIFHVLAILFYIIFWFVFFFCIFFLIPYFAPKMFCFICTRCSLIFTLSPCNCWQHFLSQGSFLFILFRPGIFWFFILSPIYFCLFLPAVLLDLSAIIFFHSIVLFCMFPSSVISLVLGISSPVLLDSFAI